MSTNHDSQRDEQFIDFESEGEKETLTGAMFCFSLGSLLGAVLIPRYPTWGLRFVAAYGILAGIVALVYANEDVN